MGLKSLFLRPWANQVSKQIVQWSANALKEQENIFTQILFNHIPYIMQRRLHTKGQNMVILPMKI
jgi:hypothetical protein